MPVKKLRSRDVRTRKPTQLIPLNCLYLLRNNSKYAMPPREIQKTMLYCRKLRTVAQELSLMMKINWTDTALGRVPS